MSDTTPTKTNREMLLEIIEGDWLSNQFGNILPLLEYDIEIEKGEPSKPLTKDDVKSFPIHDFEKLYGPGGTKLWYVEQRFSKQGKKTIDDLRDDSTVEIFAFAKRIADEFRTYLAEAIESKKEKTVVLNKLAEIYNKYRQEVTDIKNESKGEGEIKDVSRKWNM